jgi:TetR/AcrR family transcriptional regulator, mexJK operon transcriptional repressor
LAALATTLKRRGVPGAAPRRTIRAKAGRPTTERVEAIERAILQAAREHFLAAGFEPVAMEAIAATAQVSKSTLYARYPTKEALLRAVVDAEIARWSEQQRRHRGPMPRDFKRRLQYHARGILTSLESDDVRAFQKLLRQARHPGSRVPHVLYEAGYAPAIKDLTKEIVRCTSDLAVPPRDPARVAEMLMATLCGWHAAREISGPISQQEMIAYSDHVIDVIFAGRAAW